MSAEEIWKARYESACHEYDRGKLTSLEFALKLRRLGFHRREILLEIVTHWPTKETA